MDEKGRLIVSLKDNVTEHQARQALAKVEGASILHVFPLLGTCYLQVPESQENEFMDKIMQLSEVSAVEPAKTMEAK